MLRLTDFETVQENAGEYYMSTKRQDEYNCVKKQRRIIFITAHSENMGEGYIVMRVVNKETYVAKSVKTCSYLFTSRI